jgi:DNA-binding NtrC family response regulator
VPNANCQQNDLTVKDAEKQLIMRALKETDGNRTLAAKKIGMSRRTFHRKLHAYHLEGHFDLCRALQNWIHP